MAELTLRAGEDTRLLAVGNGTVDVALELNVSDVVAQLVVGLDVFLNSLTAVGGVWSAHWFQEGWAGSITWRVQH